MKANILSLDGGGVRGIIPAAILSYIESEIIRLTNDPQARLVDHLHFVAGTSTGSIIGAMINTNDKKQLSHIVKLYSDLSSKVFKRSFKDKLFSLWGLIGPLYDSKHIEKELVKIFGDIKMKDLSIPCAFTGYDMCTRKPTIYTNSDDKSKYNDYKVRDIVRGSTSIPEFFKPAHFIVNGESNTVIDGGVFANNPAMIAYIEAGKTKSILKKFKKLSPKNTLLLSFGTGQAKLVNYKYNNVKKWGMTKWLIPILNILLQAINEVTNYEMTLIYESNKSNQNFIRINPPIILGNSSATDASKENLNHLLLDAQHYINNNKEYLTNIAKQIIKQ